MKGFVTIGCHARRYVAPDGCSCAVSCITHVAATVQQSYDCMVPNVCNGIVRLYFS